MSAPKLVSNAQEIVKQLSPFFTAQIHFRSASGDYDCALCGTLVKDNDKSAISYGASKYGTWVHAACVKQARAEVVNDNEAKAKAKQAATKAASKDRKQVARGKGKNKDADTSRRVQEIISEQETGLQNDIDKAAAQKVQEVEAKYEALMTEALEMIVLLEQKLAGATAQIDQMRAALREKQAVA